VSGVILGLLVVVHKKYGTSDIGDLVKIEQEKDEIVRESESEVEA
jgi:hypothetical protein